MEPIFGDNTINIFDVQLSAEQLFSEDEHFKIRSNDDELLADLDTHATIKVEPKKRAARNVRQRLSVESLSGHRGFQTIENYFSNIKFKGRNFEINDADEIMRRLRHWAHRLHPAYNFDDILSHIERLGKKKALQVHMSRYRLGMLEKINLPSDDNEAHDNGREIVDEPYDEFDALLGEQILISKLDARQHSIRDESTKSIKTFSNYSTTSVSSSCSLNSIENIKNDTRSTSFTTEPHAKTLTSKQVARIAKNKFIAQQLRSIKQNQGMKMESVYRSPKENFL